ncbi:hypothetical protein VTN77DRAFT_6482 [Rasamsonia byssochlamydoides]|uniref:uncharacterized protein n=1 Tax=Rasamsonia byssochlamydoides TaxID=89139 RepID=UPI003743FE21
MLFLRRTWSNSRKKTMLGTDTSNYSDSSRHSSEEAVSLLIEHGAPITGNDALLAALQAGRTYWDVATRRNPRDDELEFHADPTVEDAMGMTALQRRRRRKIEKSSSW